MSKIRHFVTVLFIFLCVSAALRFDTAAQVRPVYDRGAVGLMQMLKRLNTTASVLMIGAHPDDEDTALLAYLARGESARTAYLSLTRGDGGQNIIGSELGESLGVIRTEELLQARRLDGAEQYFTRAYDFGFSKTLAEAKQKWDEKVILCDAVRVIRNFRPLVVISQFSGTPADGHGQHQFAGYISPLAAKAAADATQCKDAGFVWQVKKFYVRHRGTGEPTLRINTGKYDPLLGRSYFEIAMEARSQHKSQEQGVLELKGDQYSSLNLSGGGSMVGKETSIFDGLDISTSQLRLKVSTAVAAALKEFRLQEPDAILPKLLDAHMENIIHLTDLFRQSTHGPENPYMPPSPEAIKNRAEGEFLQYLVNLKNRDLIGSILLASGLRIDVLSDREMAVPGDEIPVSIRLFYPPGRKVSLYDLRFNIPHKVITPSTQNQPQGRREVPSLSAEYRLSVPQNFPVSQPHWLSAKRNGFIFDTGTAYPDYRPFQEAAIQASVMIDVEGKHLMLELPVEYRYADDIRGEVRREINIVPKLSVAFGEELVIVPSSTKPVNREVDVTVTNNTAGRLNGRLALKILPNWTAVPNEGDFAFERSGEKRSLKFTVTIPRNTAAGAYAIEAEADVAGEKFSQTMQTIAYDHIQTHRIYRPAKAEVKVFDLRTAPARIGYITGSGDRVPEAIRQMGFSLEIISESELANGNLSKYETIVVGIRAYQVRPDVVANNQRLLDYATAGGTLIVQYQLPGYAQQNLAPFPHQMGPRVTDENAKVTILQPDHPMFNYPNKITDGDFAGWVQERNLYNFSTMDAKYTGLLESHDAGEPENKGGLVIAKIGKGNYVYCSYSMFRQLPAGVPGAYRLFANLVSLPKSK